VLRNLALSAAAAVSLSCGGGEPPSEPAEREYAEGVFEGTADLPGGTEAFASLALRGDGSGLFLIDAYRGLLDGSATVVSESDSTLFLSVSGGGRCLGCSLSVAGDTLSGAVAFPGDYCSLSVGVRMVFVTDRVPSEQEFFSKCLFVPAGFTVPEGFETAWCRVRMLTEEDAEADYAAVMSSGGMLRELTGGTWPSRDMTQECERADLRMFQAEHEAREAFTYAVVSPGGDSILGRVSVTPPPPGTDADAAVRFWLRRDLWAEGSEERFLPLVMNWIEEDWPFDSVVYPGREANP